MRLNHWKSVLVSWANALEVAPTTLNFIGDLSPDFFINLCSYLNENEVNTLEEAVTYITDYYKSLILGNEEDENYVVLIATAYLMFTSVHKTNDELCKRLCRVSDREQAQVIKSALEAFVGMEPAKITKELIFLTLSQLPEEPDSCGNSPYLTSSGSRSSNRGTPDGDTPNRPRQRSSRFKRVKHQLQMTMTIKNCLQEELDSARETISNLESVVLVKNKDIAQLRERCQRLQGACDASSSRGSSGRHSPVSEVQECRKCKALERQVSSHQEDALHDKLKIEELTESLATLNKKISKLESEQRSLDGQLRLYEEQIMSSNDEITALQQYQKDLIANKNELESIIEELRDARDSGDTSIGGEIPNNLGNEVIDLQLCELRLTLDNKDHTIHELEFTLNEKNEEISLMKDDIMRNQSAIQEMLQEKKLINDKVLSLQDEVEKLTGQHQLATTQLDCAVKLKEEIEQQLHDSLQRISTLSADLEKLDALLKEQEESLIEKNGKLSSLENEMVRLTDAARQEKEKNKELEQTVALKEKNLTSLEQKMKHLEQALQLEVDSKAILDEAYKVLQSTLVEKNEEITMMKDEILKNQSVIQETLQEKELSNDKVLSLQDEVEKLTGQHQLATTQLDCVQKLKREIEQQLHDSLQYISRLSEDLEKRERESEKLEGLLKEQEEIVTEKNGKLSSLENEMVRLTAAAHQEKEKNEELEQTVALKEKNLTSLEQKLKHLEQALQLEVDSKAILDEANKVLQSTLVEKSEEITMMKDEILKNQSVIQETLQEKELSNDKVLSLQDEVEKLTGQHQLATTQLDCVRKLKGEIEQQLHDSLQRISRLSEDLEKHQEELKKREGLLMVKEELLTEKNEKLSSLEDEVVRLTAAAHQEKEKNEELEQTFILKEKNLISLEQKMKHLEQTLQLEVDSKAILDEANKVLQSTLVEKSEEITTMKDEILKNQSVIQETLQEKELSNDKVLSLLDEVEKLTGQHQLVTTQLDCVQKLKEEIDQQLNLSLQHITRLSEDLGNRERESEKLEALLKEQEELLTDRNGKLSSLEDEVVRLTVAAHQEKEKNEELEQTVALKEKNLTSLEQKMEHLEQALQLEVDSKAILDESYKVLQSTLVEKSEEIAIMKDEISKNQSVIQETLQEKELSNDKVLSLEDEVDKLTGQHQHATTQLDSVQKLKEEIEQQLHDSLQHISRLSEDLVKRERESEKLEALIKEQEELLTDRNGKLSSLDGEVVRLTAAAHQEKEKNEELEQTVALKEKHLSSLEQKMKHLEQALQLEVDSKAILDESYKVLQSTLVEKSEEITMMKDEIMKNQSVIQETIQEKDLSNDKVLSLEDEVEKLTGQHQLATIQLDCVQKLKEEIDRQLHDSLQHISRLSEDLEKRERESEKLEALLKEQEELQTDRNGKLSSMENEMVRLTAAAHQEKEKNKELEQTVALKEQNLTSLEQKLKHLEQALQLEVDSKAILDESYKVLQSTLVEKSEEITMMKDEILKNQSMIQETLQEKELSNDKVLSLQDEVEKLTGQHQLATTQLDCVQKLKEEIEHHLHDSLQHISRLSEDLEKRERESEKLEALHKEQEELQTDRNGKLSSLENEMVRLTAAAHQEKEKNEELEQTVALKEKHLTSLEQKMKHLEQALQLEVDSKAILDESYKVLQSTLVEKSEEITMMKDEILKNQSMIQETLQEKELSNDKVLSLQDEVEKLTGQHQLATTQLDCVQKLKEEIEHQLHDSLQHISRLSEDLEKRERESEKLEALLKEQEELQTDRIGKLSSLENEMVRLTAAAHQEKEKNEELEQTVALKEQNLTSLEQKLKHLEQALQFEVDSKAILDESYKVLQSTLVEKSEEITMMKDEILKNQSMIQETLQEKELSNDKVLSLQDEVEKLTGQHQLATTRLDCVQKLKGEIEQELHDSLQHISRLSEELEKRERESENLEGLLKEQEEIVTEENGNLSSLENEMVRLTAAAHQEKEKNEELEQTVVLKEKNLTSLEQKMKHLEQALQLEVDSKAILDEANKVLQSTLVEKSEEITMMKDEILKNQSVVQETLLEKELSNDKVLSLQDEVEKLTGQHQLATTQLDCVQKLKEEIEQQLHDSLQRISRLSANLEKREGESQKLESLVKDKEDALAVVNEKLSFLENEAANSNLIRRELEMENCKFKYSIDALNAEIVRMTQSNEVTDAKLLKVLEQKNVVEERVTSLEEQLRDHIGYEDNLQQTLLALKIAEDNKKELALKFEEVLKYQESLRLEKAHTETKILSLEGEVKRLEKENELATSRSTRLERDTESLNRRIDNSNMDLDIKNETILMMETTLTSLNSKIALLEGSIKEKDSVISSTKSDLHNAKDALEKYREETQSKLLSSVDEMKVVVKQKDAELAKLQNENDSMCQRIATMAQELVQVSQTFNIEKTSLVDHAKNLEEMLDKSTSSEKTLQNKIATLTKQLELKEDILSQLNEKLSFTIEIHNREMRELKSKNDLFRTQTDENKLKYDRLLKDMEESNLEHISGKISRLEKESQELRDKLDLKTKDIQWYVHELEVLQKSANNSMKINSQLEEEIQTLTRSKSREVALLEKEIAALTEKNKQRDSQDSADISARIRIEYEEKLEKLKAKMRKVYNEKMEAMLKFQTGEEKMYMDEELKKEKNKRLSLEAKVRELSDQLLIVQEEKRALISNNIFRAPAYPLSGSISNPAYELHPMHKAHSLDRLPVASHGLDNLGADLFDESSSNTGAGAVLHLDQSFSSRRTSTSSNRSSHLPKGIGKVFPAAEEDGEVFDNRCLADLKEGICTLPLGPGGVDRLSILQQRNSMCPPHLKSSYPVESQFFTPNSKEEEIKVISRRNKENQPDRHRSVSATPSSIRSLATGRRKH